MSETTASATQRKVNVTGLLRQYGIVLVFLLLVIVLTIISPNNVFATPQNWVNILQQTAINGILAMGMMFVILSGHIDLSVGSIVGLSGVVAALLAQSDGGNVFVAVLAAALVGLLVGLFNGFATSYGMIPAFIVTLGTLSLVRGLALIVSGGMPVTGVSSGFADITGRIGSIPLLAIYFVVVAAICAFVLSRTVFGRHVYAIGGNAQSAAVSGIRVKLTQLVVFGISGLCAGIAGALTASRTITGSPTAGQSYELDAIAAVIIGGVSMAGGLGKWYGVVVGALLIAVIGNGLDLLGVNANYQLVVKGSIIILAVFFDLRGKRSLGAI